MNWCSLLVLVFVAAVVITLNAEETVITSGGNADGAACVFPFTYRGKSYNTCQHHRLNGKQWCCTVKDCGGGWRTLWKAKQWGYCEISGEWDHLSVTTRKYSPLPTEEDEAKTQQWKLIADSCTDTSDVFHGRRYMLGDEHATILIFDVKGRIAGMQMAFKAGNKKYETGKYGGAYQLVEVNNATKYYFMTAYFTDPNKVCSEDTKRNGGVIGEKLIFLIGKDKYVEGPLNMEGTKGSKWTLGKCFPRMGTHYWYDISRNMDCGDIFPFFLMYDKKKLTGWGYAFKGWVDSPRVEHPPSWLLWAFFKKESLPQCLKSGSRTTQHVYMTKVAWLTHLCNLG